MRLRTQVLAGISVLTVIVVVLLFVVVTPQVRRTFVGLEDAGVKQDISRVENAIRAELTALESTADDWGAWDDTASFVRGEMPEYVEENLVPAIFRNLRLSFMVFFDASGQLFFSRGFDAEWVKEAPVPPATLATLGRVVGPLQRPDETASYAELVDLGGVYGLVAFHPILNSQHELPSSGTLALGRLLTAAEIARLAAQVQLPLDIRSVASGGVSASVMKALTGGTGTVVYPLDGREVAGYSLWKVAEGVPAVLSFVVPRTTFRAGQDSLRYLTEAVLLMLVGLGIGFVVFLNVRVLSRTSRLTADVVKIAESQDPTARVTVPGKDELAGLGEHINGMLASIEESREALARSERQYHSLFESSRDPIYITAEDGRFIDVNQALVDLLGYTKEEIMTMTAGQFYVNPEDREAFQVAIGEKGFVTSYPVTLKRKDGAHLRCLLTSILETSTGNEERVYQGIIRDVTELLRNQEKLSFLATHDPLTGLLTRGALDDVLRLEIARAMRNLERLAVFYLDLDRFKEVNDMHGHAAGDRVLQEVGVRLREALRASDTIARLGGDEFVALLPGIDSPRDAEVAADKILQALRDSFEIPDDGSLGLSVSIGIALFPDDGESGMHLLQRADAAMYVAKTEGRDGWRRYNRDAGAPSRS